MIESWPMRERLYPLLGLLVYFGITHNLIFTMPRFRLPFEPILILFAVDAIFKVRERMDPAAAGGR